MANAMEWFFGTDPLAFDSIHPYRIREGINGSEFGFQRNAEIPLDVSAIQLSTDLVNWQTSEEAARVTEDSGESITHSFDLSSRDERSLFVRLVIIDLLPPQPALSFGFDQATGDSAVDAEQIGRAHV